MMVHGWKRPLPRSRAAVWRQWVVAPFLGLSLAISRPAAALQGSVQTVTFHGPVTGQPVTFSLYLPPAYHSGTNRYPVIYHLHGIGGTHSGQQTNLVPASLESAAAAGLIEPCIIVFPDGYGDSFWADSANSSKPAETNVRQEIIPYIDANFRTLSSRARRAIQGFSMGGFGAAKFATKFPELFAACVVYDGAMLTWTQVQQRHPVQAAEIFNNNAAVFDLYSPWHWLSQNGPDLGGAMPFRDAVGALLNENRAWRDALAGQAITPEYTETGCPHTLGCLLDSQGTNSWAFIKRAFSAEDNAVRLALLRQGDDVVLQWSAVSGKRYAVEHRGDLGTAATWQLLATNLTGSNVLLQWAHSKAFLAPSGFYRLSAEAAPPNSPLFSFTWTGTNFTYSDAARTFSGILLKPEGAGPFPAVVISHGAGGSPQGYSLPKAREMLPWGFVCIGPALTHVAGGETNAVNMGFCPENLARIESCLDVLASLPFADTNHVALFGHSMGAFATIGSAGVLTSRLRAAVITGGGILPDGPGTTNATPTLGEAITIRTPFLMIHCDGDPVVPASRSQLLQQVLNSNSVPNLRVLVSSNSIPNPGLWHNIHQDPGINTLILTNTRAWFQAHGLTP